MEVASNLTEAMAFWNATNNTLGINHGIGSAADNRFLALETKVPTPALAASSRDLPASPVPFVG